MKVEAMSSQVSAAGSAPATAAAATAPAAVYPLQSTAAAVGSAPAAAVATSSAPVSEAVTGNALVAVAAAGSAPASAAACAPASAAAAAPFPTKSRRGTNIGLLLLKTETVSNPCVMMFYFTLDGDVAFPDFRQRVLESVSSFDRFTSTVCEGSFVDAGNFSIDDHVHEATEADLGGPPTQALLCQYLEGRFTMPLDTSRPMWEMILLRRYRANGDAVSPAQSVVIARIHHVIVDGTASMSILGAMSDESAAGTLSSEAAKAKSRDVVAKFVASHRPTCGPLGVGAGVVGVLCKYVANCFRPEPPSPFRGISTPHRSIAWTTLDAHTSLETARAHGATLNDVWMSALAGAMGGYMRQRGLPTEGLDLTVGMPVSLHSPVLDDDIGRTAGNRFGFILIRLPMYAFASRQERLHEVHRRLMVAKSWPEAVVSNAIASFTGCLPDAIVRCGLSKAGNGRTSTIMSNVRGPTEKLHMRGVDISSLNGFLSTPAGVALGLGLGTYAGRVALSVSCDRGLLGDDAAGQLMQMMIDDHEALCAAVDVSA